MKKNKRIWEIISGVIGITAIIAIVPSCIVSCGSSTNSSGSTRGSTSSNSSNQTNANYNYNPTLFKADASDAGVNISPSTIITSNEAKATDWSTNQLNLIDNCINTYTIASTNLSTLKYPYYLMVDLPSNLKEASCNWYSINTNNIISSNEGIADTTSKNAKVQYIQYLIKNFGTPFNTYYKLNYHPNNSCNELSINNPATASNNGYMFICVIKNGDNIYYSKAIWLQTMEVPNSNVPNISNTGATYSLILDNQALKKEINKNGKTCYYLPNDKTVLNFSLQLFSQKEFYNNEGVGTYELNSQDFFWGNNSADYVQYTVNYNNGNDNPYVSAWLPLSALSSWTFSTTAKGFTRISVQFDSGGFTEARTPSTDATNYYYYANYASISWNNGPKVEEGSSNEVNANGYCWYSKPEYYWQLSTDDGKTWNNINNQSGTIYNNNIYSNYSFWGLSYNLAHVTNSIDQYRLKITNANNESEFFYSNVITENDSLINPIIKILTTTTTTIPKNVIISMTLMQYDKQITDPTTIAKLSGSLNVYYLGDYHNRSYLNVSNLSKYYDAKTKMITFSIPMSYIININNDQILSTNYDGDYILISFTLNNNTTSNVLQVSVPMSSIL